MPRGKQRKRRTMRKPRASLRITNNNLNLSEDPNLYTNLISAHYERQEYRQNMEAKRKYDALPKDTFLFSIEGETRRPGTNKPIRATDFLQYLEEASPFIWSVQDIKILYKGLTDEESYFCYFVFSTRLSPEQQEYKNTVNSWIQAFWNVYFLPAVDFFKNEDDYSLPIEPTRYFQGRLTAWQYLRKIPHLEEKAIKERFAMRTLPESIRRLQRQAIVRAGEQYTKETKREVPENVERVIQSFI